MQQLDVVGQLLIGTNVALILLPLTLAPTANYTTVRSTISFWRLTRAELTLIPCPCSVHDCDARRRGRPPACDRHLGVRRFQVARDPQAFPLQPHRHHRGLDQLLRVLLLLPHRDLLLLLHPHHQGLVPRRRHLLQPGPVRRPRLRHPRRQHDLPPPREVRPSRWARRPSPVSPRPSPGPCCCSV